MNHLYYGDNLTVLRDSIRDESVDLIYLDPPFNSNASYNVLFKGPAGAESAAQIEALTTPGTGTTAPRPRSATLCAGAMRRRRRCCGRSAAFWATMT
jgi:hypothetical protein